ELGPVAPHVFAHVVEELARDAGGVVGTLHQARRDGADEDYARHALAAVPTDVAGDLSAAGRVADQHHVPEIEFFDDTGEVVGVGVHVVARPRLVRAPVAPAVVRDHAEAAL